MKSYHSKVNTLGLCFTLDLIASWRLEYWRFGSLALWEGALAWGCWEVSSCWGHALVVELHPCSSPTYSALFPLTMVSQPLTFPLSFLYLGATVSKCWHISLSLYLCLKMLTYFYIFVPLLQNVHIFLHSISINASLTFNTELFLHPFWKYWILVPKTNQSYLLFWAVGTKTWQTFQWFLSMESICVLCIHNESPCPAVTRVWPQVLPVFFPCTNILRNAASSAALGCIHLERTANSVRIVKAKPLTVYVGRGVAVD